MGTIRRKRNGSISKSQGITRVENPGWIQNSGRGEGGSIRSKNFSFLCFFVIVIASVSDYFD
jgi:predicted outer membrane repeat protein